RWCPWIATDGLGLVLDTTGSDHFWGGEANMLVEMETRLALLGLSVRLAIAPNWGAAWALARFGPVRAVCHDLNDLLPLPVAALRLDDATIQLLQRLGLKRVGDLVAVPRLALARRFIKAEPQANPLLRRDQAMGKVGEPLNPAEIPATFRANARLAEPILDPGVHLPGLCNALCEQLTLAGHGARRLRLAVYRTDGEVRQIEVALATATREAAHLAFLFRDRLEQIDPGFGFDLISLQASVTEAFGMVQNTLSGEPDETLELSQLVDRLTVRFGPKAIARLVPRASHIPERAETRALPLVAALPIPPPLTGRPQRLFDPAEEIRVLYAVPEGPPLQFVWRRQIHRVTRYQGPERIAPEWWQDKPGTRLRDYFKVEDDAGRRYWLYRQGLHDDGRGGDPRWFLHGVFA
ncbi:MAG: DNA polymerase Y family protein, partial [Paracoccaceae bacterium]